MSNLYNEVYIISINDGEEEQNIFDANDARALYNALVADPAENYKNICLIKYNYDTKEEIVLDSHEYELVEDLIDTLANSNLELVNPTDSLPVSDVPPNEIEIDYSKYTVMVYTAQAFANDVKYIHWNCCGKKFDRIHSISEEYYNKLNNDLDLLAEIALENTGITLASPSNMVSKIDWPIVENTNKIFDADALIWLSERIELYINALMANYTELPSDIQSEIDTLVRFWKKELNYKLARRLEAAD